jgi:hypothetical protein
MMTSSSEDANRAAMDAWMRRHPDDVHFSLKHDVAFCMHPDSVLGIDSAGAKVVEGMHATKTYVIPVAVKVVPGTRTPPVLPFYTVQRNVPTHANVSDSTVEVLWDGFVLVVATRPLLPRCSLPRPLLPTEMDTFP